MNEGIECNRLVLRRVRIAGPLNLTGAGKPGSPVIPFELHECELEGGVDASHAQLQGISISDCTLVHVDKASQKELRVLCGNDADAATLVGTPGQPPRLRFTGATISEKVEVKNLVAPSETILDFSHATLEHGCEITNVGQENKLKGNKWGDSKADVVSCLTFVSAEITGGLTLKGVRVRASYDVSAESKRDGRAVNCTELLLKGSFNLESSEHRSTWISGEFTLTGADIRGDLRCTSLQLECLPWMEKRLDAPLSMEAQGLKLGGSLLLGNFHAHETTLENQQLNANVCAVRGQIDLDGARIDGDLQVGGKYQAIDHTRMIKAKSVQVGGDVRFGEDGVPCLLEGEIDFSNATVGGKFLVSGARIWIKRRGNEPLCEARPFPSPPDERPLRRWRKFAVKLFGASIHGSLVMQGWQEVAGCNRTACIVEGLGLTGTTIHGQFVLQGVELRHVPDTRVASLQKEPRKALSANGVTIHGGIFAGEELDDARVANSTGDRRQTVFDGDVRLRNARIDGPVILRGVRMETSGGKVAFWAAGTMFGSDFICQPGRKHPIDIKGEFNLSGASIQGDLKLTGCKLDAQGTGTALEAPHLTVHKFAYIGAAAQPFEPEDKAGLITGILNLNFLTCARLTIGGNPPEPTTPSQQEPVSTTEEAAATKVLLTVTGAILLQGAQVHGPVVFSGLELLPSELLTSTFASTSRTDSGSEVSEASGQVKDEACKKLKVLSVYRERVLLSANYATLGSRMFVRLERSSNGFISLYGARTGTIGALHTDTVKNGVRKTVDECWGAVPKQVGRWRAGSPAPWNDDDPSVTLNLDEFRYDRLFDKIETGVGPDREIVSRFNQIWWPMIGRPSPDDVLPRHQWLRQQVKYSNMPTELVIWPYRQLAKVYRDMGDLKRAYVYERERRWLQIFYGNAKLPQRCIDFLFGALFGFGYSSGRALCWLVLWYAAFTAFLFWFGVGHESAVPIWWQGSWFHTLYHAASDAIQLLVPDTLKLRTSLSVSHFEYGWTGIAVKGELFGFAVGIFQVIGRIIVIGATLTFTGVLQEKAQVAVAVRD